MCVCVCVCVKGEATNNLVHKLGKWHKITIYWHLSSDPIVNTLSSLHSSLLSFCRTLAYYIWMSDYAVTTCDKHLGNLPFPFKQFVCWNIQRNIRKQLHGHGMGRHTEKEIYGIAERDLQAVSSILGRKSFLFGSEKPCLADAALFAFVAVATWECPDSPHAKFLKSELINLERHAERMKELFFPDWNEITAAEKPKSS